MKNLLLILLVVLFIVPSLIAGPPEGTYFNGYIPLVEDDTLTTSGVATDSVRVYTTEHEQFGDTLYFGFYIRAAETGAQVGNLDIDLSFSTDSSSGFSAYQALIADLDVGATCDGLWYQIPTVSTNAQALYCLKWLSVTIDNTDADANEVIIHDFGIAFKKKL